MRKLKLLNRAFLCAVVCSLSVMYLAAFVSYQEYGKWPSYGNPESWSSYPFDAPSWSVAFSAVPILVLLVFPIAAIGALAGAIGNIFVVKTQRLRGLVEPALLLVAIASAYIDPSGVTTWFVD
jgi:hypothetical protein